MHIINGTSEDEYLEALARLRADCPHDHPDAGQMDDRGRVRCADCGCWLGQNGAAVND
jgi:hypothetical protein